MGLTKYLKAAFVNRWNVLVFLGSLGVATAGTALSAISAQARMRELMLPLLLTLP